MGSKGSNVAKNLFDLEYKNLFLTTGLGLFHAKKYLLKWNGEILVESKVNKGTDITITLPLQEEPSWFIPKLILKKYQKIVIIDDDYSIHQIWNKKLKTLTTKNKIQIIHFSNPHDFRHWLKSNKPENVTYLCDFEFIGHKDNGLDIIDQENIAKNPILITGHYEENILRKKCEKLGLKLIPKMMAELVPIEII